jgi:hypothetical protein
MKGITDYISELAGVVALPQAMSGTLMGFARRVRVLLEEEQRKPNPDNALIGLLCDAGRLGYEFLEHMGASPIWTENQGRACICGHGPESHRGGGLCEECIPVGDSTGARSGCQSFTLPEVDRTGWRTMDSAPLDGTEVLLAVELRAGIPGRCLVGHHMAGGNCIEDHPPIDRGWYFWNGCMFDRAAAPILWMPLPPVPGQKSFRG